MQVLSGSVAEWASLVSEGWARLSRAPLSEEPSPDIGRRSAKGALPMALAS